MTISYEAINGGGNRMASSLPAVCDDVIDLNRLQP
jgi:hypothetical protein